MDNFKSFSQFLDYIERNYEEEQQIIIENFMSYYINEYRRFGKYNCKCTYDDDLQSDKTGELHKLALIGFEFEKKIHNERECKKINKREYKK
jgi:hypothetical protein